MVPVRWVHIDAVLRWFTQEEWLHRSSARNQGPLEQRERGIWNVRGRVRAEPSNQEHRNRYAPLQYDPHRLDNDRTWYLEALTRWLYFSGSGVDGSLHCSALLNLQTDPVILAKAPLFPNLVIGKHTEQTRPHLVESWPTLQRTQGGVIEDSRFSMKF